MSERAPSRYDPAALVDWLLETDARLLSLTKKLHLRQGRLRGALSRRQYRLYLLIEETANDRCFELAERLCAVVRHPAPRTGPPANAPERNSERCGYRVKWSAPDALFEASCEEFPSVTWRDADAIRALTGIMRLIREMAVSSDRAGEESSASDGQTSPRGGQAFDGLSARRSGI